MVFVDEGDAPKSFEQGQGALDGGKEFSFIEMGDQLSDDFGVCIGVKATSLLDEHSAQMGVVFNDPVMDDGDRLRFIEMGMGVFFGGFSMGGPARMGDGELQR